MTTSPRSAPTDGVSTTSPEHPVTRMHVEIWSDVACPWCYIGKRRFAAALAAFPHREHVEVRWRSYQLSPEAPVGSDRTEAQMLAETKGIPLDAVEKMFAHVTGVAATVGLRYRFAGRWTMSWLIAPSDSAMRLGLAMGASSGER